MIHFYFVLNRLCVVCPLFFSSSFCDRVCMLFHLRILFCILYTIFCILCRQVFSLYLLSRLYSRERQSHFLLESLVCTHSKRTVPSLQGFLSIHWASLWCSWRDFRAYSEFYHKSPEKDPTVYYPYKNNQKKNKNNVLIKLLLQQRMIHDHRASEYTVDVRTMCW